LSEATRTAASSFEILVELEGAGYRYRVEATQSQVTRELLEFQDARKGATWLKLIDRDTLHERCVLHEQLGNESRRKQIEEDTRPNALILSRAAERHVKPILPLYNWFSENVRPLRIGEDFMSDTQLLGEVASKAAQNPRMLERLARYVRDADTGIAGLQIVKNVPPAEDRSIGYSGFRPITESEFRFLRALIESPSASQKTLAWYHNRVPQPFEFLSEHESSDRGSIFFGMDEESGGTRRYVAMIGQLLQYCLSPALIVVDELDSSLHPLLTRRLIELAHSPEMSRAGAQVIFTTHDATLLDPTLLRRDQIVLMEKRTDSATELYSLWDFEEMPRNTAAWARNYLAGRFGAVPVFGPLLADVVSADEMTPIQSPEAGAEVG
jgi:hypothetical protein